MKNYLGDNIVDFLETLKFAAVTPASNDSFTIKDATDLKKEDKNIISPDSN